MGRIRGTVYNAETEVNGVRLGQPIITRADGTPPQEGDALTDLVFAWDDSRLPDGEIDPAGVVAVDAVELAPDAEPVVVEVKVAGLPLDIRKR